MRLRTKSQTKDPSGWILVDNELSFESLAVLITEGSDTRMLEVLLFYFITFSLIEDFTTVQYR